MKLCLHVEDGTVENYSEVLKSLCIYCFKMEESNNLLAALQAMLKMKTAVVKPTASLEPEPSTSPGRNALTNQTKPHKT